MEEKETLSSSSRHLAPRHPFICTIEKIMACFLRSWIYIVWANRHLEIIVSRNGKLSVSDFKLYTAWIGGFYSPFPVPRDWKCVVKRARTAITWQKVARDVHRPSEPIIKSIALWIGSLVVNLLDLILLMFWSKRWSRVRNGSGGWGKDAIALFGSNFLSLLDIKN